MKKTTIRRTPAFPGSPAVRRAADGEGRSQHDPSNQGRSPGAEFQGDGSHVLPHRCERSAPEQFEGIPGGGRMGGEAPQGIRPRQCPPGKVGTVRQGLEPGTLFGPHAGTDVPADHRHAGGMDGGDEWRGQRQSDSGDAADAGGPGWVQGKAGGQDRADFAEAGPGDGDHAAGRAL